MFRFRSMFKSREMKKIFFVLGLILVSTSASCQFFLAGGHFNGSVPVGQLKQETGSLFFPTLSGILLYEFRTAPLQVGLELGYGIYGSKLEKRTDLYPGFTDELRLRRNNNLGTGMVVIRYLPAVNTKLTPFIEAQMGANFLYTRYKIRETILSEEAIETGMDYSDWTIGYRIGAGLQIPLGLNDNLRLEFRGTFQDGNSARFLQKGDVSYLPDEGIFDYNFRRSPLQYMTFSVGIIGYDVFR
ncbi:Opacity protein [Algoriphagus faecimaris]|uniref:Opacity protein n=2 Tax=Algoriphagus faecimaris TaxID=686796 RepID=A0A1G6VTZ4_9BACT|nr:Opacity protein [Algoriphagus faecimaris]